MKEKLHKLRVRNEGILTKKAGAVPAVYILTIQDADVPGLRLFKSARW